MAGRLLAWRAGALPVLALLAATTIFLYWPARRCGLISDAWGLLWIANLGLEKALLYRLSYHIIPVTHLLNVILWKTFGVWQPGYQLVNLAELGLTAWLLYFLGLRLFRRPRAALLAALLLLANASFYEVTFWPVVGNFQSLAAMLQIAGVLAALRAAASPRPAPWAALFAVLAVLAFFTYEPAVSLLAAGVLAAVLVPPEGADLSLRSMVRRSLPVLAAAVLAFACMLAGKLSLAGPQHTALFLPGSWDEVRTRLLYLVRACLGIFTLRGNDGFGYQLYHLGSVEIWQGHDDLLLAGWLAVLGQGTLLAVWKTRQPAVVLLLLWFWIHVLTVSVATIIQSRMYLLAALPASLLLAWAMTRAADAAARRLRGTAAVSASLSFLAFGFLAAGAKVDLDTAAKLHGEVTENHREIVRLLRNRIATGSSPESVVLVNMPVKVVRDGFGAYAFANAIHGMLSLEQSLRFEQIRLVAPAGPGTGYVTVGQPMSLPEVGEKVRDPRCLVLRYDRQSGHVVEVTRITWSIPGNYTTAETPYLPWSDAPWPSFPLEAGKPLELPLEPPGPGTWGAVKLLRIPATDLSIAAGGAVRLQVRPEQVTPSWPILPFPLPAGARPTVLTLTSASGTHLGGVWTFRPPARYTPEAAPFLPWWFSAGEMMLVVEGPVQLPLAAPGCAARPCAVRVEYMTAPDRGLTLAVEGGERREIDSPAGEPPGWRTVELSAGPAPVTVLHVAPRGSFQLMLRSVSLEPPGSSTPASKLDILETLDHGLEVSASQ